MINYKLTNKNIFRVDLQLCTSQIQPRSAPQATPGHLT
jgi:hypothetical protein